MSIRQEISNRVAEGRLVKLETASASDPVLRSMYLTSELYSEVIRDRDDIKEVERFANLTADLEAFITYELLSPDYLWQLDPERDGVWEIRSTNPCPQIRVFGMFAEKNIFIGTHCVDRDILGDRNTEKWKVEIRRAKAKWKSLFHSYTHKTSTHPNYLFTGALNEQYSKFK